MTIKEADEIVRADSLPAVEHDTLLGDLHGALVDLSVRVDQTKDSILERIALHSRRLDAALQAVNDTLNQRESEFNRKLTESLGIPLEPASRADGEGQSKQPRRWTDQKRGT